MLYVCPKCGNRAVSWCARCRSFLCLWNACACWFPVMEIAGIGSDEVIRRLGIHDVDDEEVQKWLEGSKS